MVFQYFVTVTYETGVVVGRPRGEGVVAAMALAYAVIDEGGAAFFGEPELGLDGIDFPFVPQSRPSVVGES